MPNRSSQTQTSHFPRLRDLPPAERGLAIRYSALPTLRDLRQHVLETLCRWDRLDPEQTPLRHGLIVRSGKPCGLFFQVQGPRLLKAYAIWAGEENRVLFYDSTGQRFAETRLSEAPDWRELHARAA